VFPRLPHLYRGAGPDRRARPPLHPAGGVLRQAPQSGGERLDLRLHRRHPAAEIRQSALPRAELARELYRSWEDGRIKLLLTQAGLAARREQPELFAGGGDTATPPCRSRGLRRATSCATSSPERSAKSARTGWRWRSSSLRCRWRCSSADLSQPLGDLRQSFARGDDLERCQLVLEARGPPRIVEVREEQGGQPHSA